MLLRFVLGIAVVLMVNPVFALDKSLVERAVVYQAKHIRANREQIGVLEASLEKPTKDKQLQKKIGNAMVRLKQIAEKTKKPIGDVVIAEIERLKKQIEMIQKNEIAVLPSFPLDAESKSEQWGTLEFISDRDVTVARTDGPMAFVCDHGPYTFLRAYFVGWEHRGKDKILLDGGAFVAGTKRDKLTKSLPLPIMQRFDPAELKEAVIASRAATKQIQEAKSDNEKVEPSNETEPKKAVQEVKTSPKKQEN